MPKNEDNHSTLDELCSAVADLSYHRAGLTDAQSQLSGKRAAIKSFEQSEADAARRVEEAEAKVKRIAANLKR
jgi:hypothetical protein